MIDQTTVTPNGKKSNSSSTNPTGKIKNLLIDSDQTVGFQRELAILVGDREAMALQQIHFWCDINRKSGHEDDFFDGQWWMYNTWAGWRRRNFPFWSTSTLRRVFSSLEAKALIIVRQHPDHNKGNWFTINYGQLQIELSSKNPDLKVRRITPLVVGAAQNEQGGLLKMNRGVCRNQQTLRDTYIDSQIKTPDQEKEKDSGAPAVTPESDEQNPSVVAPIDPEPPPIKPPAPTPDPPVAPKAARPRNPWYDAVYEIWGYVDNLNGEMQKMLQGKSKHHSFKPYNLSVTITPQELLRWAEDYREDHLGGDEDLNMLENRLKIQSSITAWKKQHSRDSIGDAPSAPKKPYRSFDPDSELGLIALDMKFDPMNLTREQYEQLQGEYFRRERAGWAENR